MYLSLGWEGRGKQKAKKKMNKIEIKWIEDTATNLKMLGMFSGNMLAVS